MNYIALIILLSNVANLQANRSVYWEDLNPAKKEEIIRMDGVDQEVVRYYAGSFPVSDNNKTFILLDSLTSYKTKKEIVTLYFYIFNQIILSSDNSISESLGKYCGQMTINYPDFVFNYFERNMQVRDAYANYLGYEFYFKYQGTSGLDYDLKQFKLILNKKVRSTLKSSNGYNEFFKRVELAMKSMD